jgi:hypothetical protein
MITNRCLLCGYRNENGRCADNEPHCRFVPIGCLMVWEEVPV